jgi:hypothetical protein
MEVAPTAFMERQPGKTGILVAILLAFAALTVSVGNFRDAIGEDFYQYWGVEQAQKLSPRELKSPYVEPSRYAAVLNTYAAGSSDARLREASRYRHELELNQTPLCFSFFSFLPANYSLAFGFFQSVQIILFLAAIIMLGRGLGENWTGPLTLALVLLIFYQPLLSDLRVGNLNSLQFFALVLVTGLARRALTGRGTGDPLGPSIVFMGALVFLTLLKPNLTLVMLLLAAHLWTQVKPAVFARAALAAAGLAVILLALPCWQFHSWQVWPDWYRYSQGLDAKKLLAFIPQGNYALVLLGAKDLGVGVGGATALLAVALLASWLAALRLAVSPGPRKIAAWGRAAARSLGDPYLSAALGVTLTLALAPLVWLHYYVLSLLPALWLLWGRQQWRLAWAAAGLALLLTSGVVSHVLMSFWGGDGWVPYSYALGWVPLWIGVLAAVAFNQKAPARTDWPVSAVEK